MDEKERAFEDLIRLHAEVDRGAAMLERGLRGRLRCGLGCSACCTDGLSVFDVEAERIRRRHTGLLENDAPHPEGACAFLDGEGSCRIYDDRPYVCRIQGLPLRWTGGDVESREICPLNADGPPIDALAEDRCWTLGPTEQRLSEIQFRWGNGRADRVELRRLFGEPSAHR